jgi:hypothetical protein
LRRILVPKRTNAFQELAAILHTKLGPGWKVTESTLLTDRVTGEPREVDVVAKAKVATYELCISIECRDHKRPADVTWVESMAKKHEHLPTSKLVLWSRSGFTKGAIAKAVALKIDTVSQASARTADWATLARQLVGSRVKLVTPKFSPFIDVLGRDGKYIRLENVSNMSIVDELGNIAQTIPHLLSFMAQNPDLGTTLLDHAPEGASDFYAEIKPPVPWYVVVHEGERLSVHRIGVGVSAFVEELQLDCASAFTEDRVATLAFANASGGRFQLYVEEAPNGSQPIKIATFRKA